MSNLDPHPRETECGGRAAVAVEPIRELISGAPEAVRAGTEIRTTVQRG